MKSILDKVGEGLSAFATDLLATLKAMVVQMERLNDNLEAKTKEDEDK